MKKLFITVFVLFASSVLAREHDFTLYPPVVPESKIVEVVPIYLPDPPQTNTFCAANLACTVTAAWTFSGTATFTGALQAKNIENILFVDGATCLANWGVADMGACLNAAYAALPAAGGEIYIASSSLCYSFSTPIAFTTSGKSVKVEGSGTKSSCLLWTPLSGTALTLDTGNSTGFYSQLTDFSIIA